MKNNNIPEYILCSTPELARQVLEKIERESDLVWSSSKEKPTIRNCKGRLIGHLIEEVDYKGEHITALNNASREVVICSAVVADDGMIYRGHRHNNCINLIREVGKKPGEQGFITSLNRFVDRKEAYKIQIEAGIESRDGYHHSLGELFSEDLY